jgi:hypothetical protein
VAVEMRKQLLAMGKEVKLLAIFDTSAECMIYKSGISQCFTRKLWRQLPKLLFFTRSFIRNPGRTVRYQWSVVRYRAEKAGLLKKRGESTEMYERFDRINKNHGKAYSGYGASWLGWVCVAGGAGV